jgi:peptidoglycan/xylan/chitin deacetylase (PgdA/CDA1 family)
VKFHAIDMRYSFFFFIFQTINLFSQETIHKNELYYEIAPVYNFKQSILSITFDDGDPIEFTEAVPLLNEREIPATFYIITRDLSDSTFRSMVYNAYLAHHEIGSHTVNHPNLAELDNSQIEFELSRSQNDINSVLGNYSCLTFAYPGGKFNDNIIQIAKKYYLTARSGLGGYNAITSSDRYRLRAMSYESNVKISQLNNIVKRASRVGLWLIEIFHGLDDSGWEPINSNKFAEHLDYIKSKESITWYATISSVIKYSDESKKAKIICEDCNDSIYNVRLNDDLNDSIYDQPLSLKINVPSNWENIEVSGAELVTTKYTDNNKFVFINALPNNKIITIKPQDIEIPQPGPLVNIINVSPNPFNEFIDISFDAKVNCSIQFSLNNSMGSWAIDNEESCQKGISTVHVNTSKFSKGIYVLKMIVNKNNQIIIKKLIKLN